MTFRAEPMMVAKAGIIALLVLPILASDTVRQFYTPSNDLGFLLFENWWKLTEAVGLGVVGWAKFNTIEVLIATTALASLWASARRRSGPILTFELGLAILLLAAVLAMFGWGLASGGDLEPALWQVRPYVQLVAVAVLVPQVVRTASDLRVLVGWMVGAIVLKALLVIGIFVFAAGARFAGWRELVGHEDSVFFVAAICFLFALLAYDRQVLRQIWPIVAGGVLLAALALNLRRAGYVALGLNVALLPILMTGQRRLAMGLVAACGLVASAYLALFWHAEGALGLLAQKVRSVFGGGESADATSNFYRASENLNLWHTVRGQPLGTGFGHPFDTVYEMADISSILPNWAYHPHNAVFGLWMQLGTVGFVLLLFFCSSTLIAASHSARQASDAFSKAVAIFCATALTSGLLVSNLDQFVSAQRGALFLGATVGLVAALGVLQGRGLTLNPYERVAAMVASK